MIAIVDYKAGNLTSVARALDHLGHRCEITDRPDRIRAADRVIIPGVGAAGATMENLHTLELATVLRDDIARAGKLFLGICIGIQVLLDRSAEDDAECLGVIPGNVVKFPSSVDGRPLKVPQIGWNRVRQTRSHPMFAGRARQRALLFRQFVLSDAGRSGGHDCDQRLRRDLHRRDRARERHRDAIPSREKRRGWPADAR